MPQTREHLQILSLLGVSRCVVALTKTDLVDADRAIEVELDLVTLLDGTALAGAEVFPVSTVTGAGIPQLRAHLLTEAARSATPNAIPSDERSFRLAVDRSFSLAGAGTVVTGSVVAGGVRTGQSVVVLPSGLRARVRGIHAANRPVEHAETGERCALNLIGPSIRKDAIGRGDWIVDPAGATVTRSCDIRLRLLPTERTALKPGTSVLLHHGAGYASARVLLLESSILPPGATGLAHLALDRPLPLRHGDLLVLRDAGASRTIAGGRALDPRPPTRYRRQPVRLQTLHALTIPDPRQALLGLLAQPPFLVRRDLLQADWGLTDAGLTALLPDVLPFSSWLASPDSVSALAREMTDALAEFHARQPAEPGMSMESLRLAVPTRLPREGFTALTAHLVGSGVLVAEAHLLRAPGHRGGLAGEDARLWDTLRSLLDADPYRPPLLREAAERIGAGEIALRRACKGFARMGLVVEVAPDRFFAREAVVAMAEAAHALTADIGGTGFTAAQFRDRLGNGRQLAIQVLDYFDRRGITVRRGDLRRAGKTPRAVFGPATTPPIELPGG
jgi:selenocysteine-specific elongation factor